MTGVEIRPKADSHLDDLDSEVRVQILKTLVDAREWTDYMNTISECSRHSMRW